MAETNLDRKLHDLYAKRSELGAKLKDRPNIQDNYWKVQQWEQANAKLLKEIGMISQQIKIVEAMIKDKVANERLNRHW